MTVRVMSKSESPKGRSSARERTALSIVGTVTLAASSSRRPSSITSDQRFCWIQPRHST
jgi:hypothetical protein